MGIQNNIIVISCCACSIMQAHGYLTKPVLLHRRSAVLRFPINNNYMQKRWTILSFMKPILYESDLSAAPDSRVIDAVENMGGGQLIASDVASTCGVSLSIASKSLAALAALTQGSVAVTSEGTLIYTFSKNIKSVLASRSRKYQIKKVIDESWPKIFGGIRVAFGVILYLQIFIVFASLFFASASITSTSTDDRRDGNRRSSSIHANIGLWDLNMAMDMLWNSHSNYNRDSNRDPRNNNLFQSIFSFVFGDGNPNQFLHDTRLKAATQLIRRNGGVVIAEQLIPILDEIPPLPSKDITESVYVDENFVLPIVSQLGGEPIVSGDGDILYFFPDLIVATETSTLVDAGLPTNATNLDIKKALTRKNIDVRYALERSDLMQLLDQSLYNHDFRNMQDSILPDPIRTEPLPFNRNDVQSNAIAAVLGLVSLFGTLKLGQMLMNPLWNSYRLPAWYALVQSSLPVLMTYSILFNAIPFGRFLVNRFQNGKIQNENEQRKEWYQRLKQGSTALRRKLLSAASIRSNIRRLSKDEIVYDSEKDSLWLKTEKEQSQLQDFDKRLDATWNMMNLSVDE